MRIFLALIFTSLAARADLKWDHTVRELAYAPGSKEVRTEFSCTNKGRAPVKIVSLVSGCKCCTSASVSRKELAPGESAVVKVRVDFSGKDLPLAKPIIITTGDGQTSTLLVKVSTADGSPLRIPKWGQPKGGK